MASPPPARGHILRQICAALLVTLATLVGLELLLRVADLRVLREGASERSLAYGYDSELGWAPTPGSTAVVTTARTIHVQNNSLGFRDIEFARDGRPVMLFIGDSFVWGVDAEADERFTDLLRSRLPGYRTVNAGVSGYGTDQEYLWLKRIWPTIQPSVVVLIFCAANDRLDNTTNLRYEGSLKPYFATSADGSLELHGQPVPKPRQFYIKNYWLTRNLWLARLATLVYASKPEVSVPDPTEKLVSKIREFVESHGAKLVVGLQMPDDRLMAHLKSGGVPYVTFEGAEAYKVFGEHWTPAGHKLVAERLFGLLSDNNLVKANQPGQ
jgi:lysophospholipase L1-like esterase